MPPKPAPRPTPRPAPRPGGSSPAAKTADPLAGIKFTGDPEKDSLLELDGLQAGFRDRMSREQKRFEVVTDSEFWLALCFQDREQKEAFIAALGLLAHGDKYLDGELVAQKLGITIPPPVLKLRTPKVPK